MQRSNETARRRRDHVRMPEKLNSPRRTFDSINSRHTSINSTVGMALSE